MSEANSTPRRVFVVGCPRSGTTFVQSRLASHPRLSTFPETKMLIELVGLRRLRTRPATPRTAAEQTIDCLRVLARRLGFSRSVRASYVEQLRGIGEHIDSPEFRDWRFPSTRRLRTLIDYAIGRFDELARRENTHGWIEKTPLHVFYTREIDAYVSGAEVFFVARDGRATVASIRQAVERGYPFWAEDFPSVEVCAEVWNASLAYTKAALDQPRHHLLNYHDFAKQPETETKRAWDLIGLSSETIPGEPRDSTATAVMPNEAWKAQVGKKSRDYGLEKFREMFSPAEQARIESLLVDGGSLASLGIDHHL